MNRTVKWVFWTVVFLVWIPIANILFEVLAPTAPWGSR